MSSGLSVVENTAWGGVAHHQVDVHVFDAGFVRRARKDDEGFDDENVPF
jgi:hypothetical protein